MGFQPGGCGTLGPYPGPPDLLTWQWSPRGELRGPGLGGWRMQERGAQLGLPQALVRRGQHWGAAWWLEVVKRSLWRGDPSLGLREQRKLLRSPHWAEPARGP